MIFRDCEKVGLIWRKSKDGRDSMTRELSDTEQMFVVLNDALFGQSCPFIGATISLLRQDSLSSRRRKFGLDELHERAVNAFCQTRWEYPTVAARICDGNTAVYDIESGEGIKQWAKRTVTVFQQDGGWLALRERLSRESPMPTKSEDSCVVYILVRPNEVALPQLSTFDVLFHMHHALTDGSGIRSILNEFLTRLGDPLPSSDIIWGQEIEKLNPPSVLLEKQFVEEPTNGYLSSLKLTNHAGGLLEPDIGLPIYRPDILRPSSTHRGTLTLSHTFEEPTFLPQLLALGHQHGIKLTALLQAAMVKAVYNSTDIKPAPHDSYRISAAVDLRTSHIIAPFNQRNKYVNSAVSLEVLDAPCELLESHDLWPIAIHFAKQWAFIKNKQGLANSGEKLAQEFMAALKRQSTTANVTHTKPHSCPYYVSDPPGSAQLEPIYFISGHKGLAFVLESYQLATDQSQAMVSARSHSWNGRLTLCVAFNAIRCPKGKMQEFLNEWVRIVGVIGKSVD